MYFVSIPQHKAGINALDQLRAQQKSAIATFLLGVKRNKTWTQAYKQHATIYMPSDQGITHPQNGLGLKQL